MKGIQIAKILFVSILSIFVIQMPQLIGEPTANDCTPQVLKVPFPEPFVRISLKKFNVPENTWEPIVKALDAKGNDVVKIVETKAAKITPNPLENPKQPQVIVKLFKETLFEVSVDTFKLNGVTDTAQIQAIIDDVQEQKRQQFIECMQEHKLPVSPTPESPKIHLQEGSQQLNEQHPLPIPGSAE